MALLANGYRDTLGAFQTFGATISNNAYPSARWANFARTGAMRNLTAGQGITSDTVSLPSGNRHPSAWMMPQKPGALAARNSLTGTGGVSDAEAWAVKLAQAALTGTGELTAVGGLIVQLVAAVTGSGEVSDADIKAFLQAVASIGGSGGVSDAELAGLGELIAAITGLGTAAGSTATGVGELSADLVVTGAGLTTGNVGAAVWSANAAANNVAGTMGQKLNSAATGGVDYEALAEAVWDKPTSTMTTSGSAGQYLVTRLLSVAKFLGLK
mgnify:CR=1 FL=1